MKRFWTWMVIFLAGIVPTWAGEPELESPELVFGISAPFTGSSEILGRNMHDGITAAFEAANRAGGVCGKKVRLCEEDDAYEPFQTVTTVRRLIEERLVLAFIGNVGTPTAVSALPIIREHGLLLFAPFTGADILRPIPPLPNVINFRASYTEEISQMIESLVKIGKVRPEHIAFFTQRDSYGDAGYKAGIHALKKISAINELNVIHMRYDRNSLAVESGLAALLLEEPQPRAVIMVGTYAACAKFIRLAQENGFDPLFLCISFGTEPMAQLLGKTSARIIVTQIVPSPKDVALPMVRDYLRDLHQLNPKLPPLFGSFEAYIDARILLHVLGGMKTPPNRKELIEAFDQLGTFDMGLGKPLHIDKNDHQASHSIWPTILKEGEYQPFEWKDLPQVLNPRTAKP